MSSHTSTGNPSTTIPTDINHDTLNSGPAHSQWAGDETVNQIHVSSRNPKVVSTASRLPFACLWSAQVSMYTEGSVGEAGTMAAARTAADAAAIELIDAMLERLHAARNALVPNWNEVRERRRAILEAAQDYGQARSEFDDAWKDQSSSETKLSRLMESKNAAYKSLLKALGCEGSSNG